MAFAPPARHLLRAKDLADVSIVLMGIPGPPVMDVETADQVRSLMSKGFAGTVFLTTDDCQATYEARVRFCVKSYGDVVVRQGAAVRACVL
jgi:hypothetical protein